MELPNYIIEIYLFKINLNQRFSALHISFHNLETTEHLATCFPSKYPNNSKIRSFEVPNIFWFQGISSNEICITFSNFFFFVFNKDPSEIVLFISKQNKQTLDDLTDFFVAIFQEYSFCRQYFVLS